MDYWRFEVGGEGKEGVHCNACPTTNQHYFEHDYIPFLPSQNSNIVERKVKGKRNAAIANIQLSAKDLSSCSSLAYRES